MACTYFDMIPRRVLLFTGAISLALRKVFGNRLIAATQSTVNDAASSELALRDIRKIVFGDVGPEDFRKYIISHILLADAYKRKVVLIYSTFGVDDSHEEVSVPTPISLQEVLQKSRRPRLKNYSGEISVVLVGSRMILTIHSKQAKGLSELVSPGDIIIGGAVVEDLGK